MEDYPQLTSVQIDGYRPFREFVAELGSLEVIVGANGAGKSSLFEFLRVLRNGMDGTLPAGLIQGGSIRRIYHSSSKVQSLIWTVAIGEDKYTGVLNGLYGQHVALETVYREKRGASSIDTLLAVESGRGKTYDSADGEASDISLDSTHRLALGTITDPSMVRLKRWQMYIRKWSFFTSFNIAADTIRNPVITEQDPVLREDAGNLSDVLQHLRNVHEPAFAELNRYMRLFVPGFESIKVKSYGAPGQVMAFWKEEGVEQELSLADLSDGIFRLLCWTVLCLMPNPPSLICIDEPDQGVHPRTLPILADLFKQASQRTQILLATHNSYFLSQFDLSQIAVMRKEEGRAVFVKPETSKALIAMLEDFGTGEIERLHKSEELERLP